VIMRDFYMHHSSSCDKSILAKLGIMPKDKVLEIGGGDNPFNRADVVVDIDFHSGHHRGGRKIGLDAS